MKFPASRRLKVVSLALLLCCTAALVYQIFLHAQRASAATQTQPGPASPDGVWQELSRTPQARTLRLNSAALVPLLNRAPLEAAGRVAASPAIVTMPLPDGRFARFRIAESPLLEPGLTARFPEIKSYTGQGVDDPAATLRFGWSPRGISGFILGSDYSVYIYPPDAKDPATCVSTYSTDRNWTCGVTEREIVRLGRGPTPDRNTSVGGNLRVFRVAIATTGEYTNDPQLGGGSIANTVASLNNWLNAINAIYEKELAIRLTLVNNTSIIYNNGATDPFTNGDVQAILNQIPAVLADNVGVNNYDLGHCFSTNGNGGVAGLGVVCNSNNAAAPAKGGGSTSMSAPVGNAGTVAVLAHEFGHQFGAAHSYNSTVDFCGSQRSDSTAWESGSGTTIMSYNGLCDGGGLNDNLSGSENTRFHNGSFTQISDYVAGTACATLMPTGNIPPNVSGGPDRTIPRNTPFQLTAAGSDPDAGDNASLTYNWEQIDAGGATFNQNGTAASYSDAGDLPTTTRPIFRPFTSSLNSFRFFPGLSYILNNANVPPAQTGGLFTAESLPMVTRTLNFRVTLRDNRTGVSDDHVTLSVDGNSGPFIVTLPNGGETLTAGTQLVLTWNVANTNFAPVNTANVKISLSTDGGLSFPFVLAALTPNDGSELVSLPSGVFSGTARIKIEAVGNIFFDISNANFSINGGAGCPLVTGISPPASNPGTTITLTGAGLTGVTAVNFSNNQPGTNLMVVNNTQITVTVPAGAVSGPLTLTEAGCPATTTGDFLVCPNAVQTAQVDDGTPSSADGGSGYAVNRLTPAAYPATLTAVQVQFNSFQTVPTGTSLTILAGTNVDGNADINNTSFQMLPATVGTLGSFATYALPTPITINAGDFVVGFQIGAGGFPFLNDPTTPQGRSYFSDNGATFTQPNYNLMIRGRYHTNCGASVNCHTVTNRAPASGAPGTSVVITGTNLTGVSAVRFNNNVGAQFVINSDTQLTATVPAGAVTSPITLSKPNCPDAQSASFTVNPIVCPTVTGLLPSSQQPGSTVTITGSGFLGVSVVKLFNNVSASFTVDSDTQISLTVPPGATPGPITLSKSGCPNVQTASFTPCNTNLALQIDNGSPGGLGGAFIGVPLSYYVNRLTPAAYPATLNSVQLIFPTSNGVPAGTNITVLAGTNTDGDNNVNSTTFQMVAAQVGTLGQFTTYNLTTPLVLNSGDFVAGFAIGVANPNTQFPAQFDTGAPQGRSYNSFNGTSFTLYGGNNTNLMIRGVYTLPCPAPPACPTVTNLTPTSGQVGSPVTITGTNFTGVTGVKFSNNVNATITNNTGTQLTVTVPADAITGSLTISKPACLDVQTDPFTVTCPTIIINPAVLNPGTVGVPYTTTQLMATGGTEPYTFQAINGAVPPGLTLTMGGLLSGTPTQQFGVNLEIRATDFNGCFVSRIYDLQINPPTGGKGLQFFPLPRPVRLLDTRASQGNCDNVGTPIAADTSITTQARINCEGIPIPASAQAIVGNITVINGTGLSGFLTLYPGGQPLPLAANLIYEPGQVLSNAFTVGLSATGQFNIYGQRTIDVVVDVSGYFAPPVAGGLYYHTLARPLRLLDTRAGQGNCDNVGTPIAADTSITTQARVSCEGLTIPAAAQAIVGNITVINGTAQSGFLTLYPGGQPLPLAANLIYKPGQVLSNAFTVGLSATGQFNIYGQRTIDVVVDVAGYYSTEATDANGPGLLFSPLSRPVRLLDTRAGQGNCDNVGTPIAADTSITTQARITCEGIPIPVTAQTVLGNITVINGTGQSGFLTLYPAGLPLPLAANLIYAPGQVLSNAFTVGLSAAGEFNVYGQRTIDVVVDVSGYFAP